MKTSLAVAERLLTAIESFVEQESLWVRAGDCVRAAAVAARNAPLISRLGALGRSDPAVCVAMGRRVDALVAKRRQNQLHLAARRIFLSGELDRNATARQRLHRLAPVYARATHKSARLNAAV